MAEIEPFKGLRYDSERLGGLTKLVAPPYDIISPELQDALYKRHEDNVVRLDFGKAEAGDGESENRYTRSAAYLRKWLDEGVLVREDKPALYFYDVSYRTPSGEARRMSGFVCMLRIEEWDKGVVLPHEGTLKGPKKDRLELMKATGVSASQIFSLYSDQKKEITAAMYRAAEGRAPDAEATDDDGSVHRMWVVKDAPAIKTARKVLADRPVFIADGHHRYETALAYRDLCRKAGRWDGDEPFNFVPMFLANMEEEGLTVLPTHRLVKDARGLTLDGILKKASAYFRVEEFGFGASDEQERRKEFLRELDARGRTSHAFGFYFDRGSSYYLLTLNEMDPLMEALRCQRSEAYCNLDVTILHTLVVERVLGINTEAISESQPVQFEKDGGKAIDRVARGEFAMCFLLNATKVREVKEVALAREIMPQKSTYFYPKLLTGLVIAELRP